MDDSQTTFDKKKLGAALGVLAILAAIAVVLYYLPVSKKEEPLKTEYTGLELAQKLEVFAQKSETQSTGTYRFQQSCKKNGGCRRLKISNRGGWTLPMGYFELYRVTGDEKYRDIADVTLERGVRYECEEGGGEEIDCLHYVLAAGIPYGYTGDSRYQRFNEIMRPSIDEHIDLHEHIEKKLAKDTHTQWEYFMHAGHILDFFMLTGEEKYRSAAVKTLESGKNVFKDKKISTQQDQCTQFLTTVDFYRILKEEKYLKEAEQLIQEYQLPEAAETISTPWAMVFCMEGYQLLYEFTGNPAYETDLNFFMKKLMATFMDHPKNNYYTGDFTILNSPGWHETNEKHLGLNLWFMRIFAKMKDMKFSL